MTDDGSFIAGTPIDVREGGPAQLKGMLGKRAIVALDSTGVMLRVVGELPAREDYCESRWTRAGKSGVLINPLCSRSLWAVDRTGNFIVTIDIAPDAAPRDAVQVMQLRVSDGLGIIRRNLRLRIPRIRVPSGELDDLIDRMRRLADQSGAPRELIKSVLPDHAAFPSVRRALISEQGSVYLQRWTPRQADQQWLHIAPGNDLPTEFRIPHRIRVVAVEPRGLLAVSETEAGVEDVVLVRPDPLR
jgi:hypothetical protein